MMRETAKRWREKSGLSQSEVARRGGVSVALICYFESGKRSGLKALNAYIEAGFSPSQEELLEYIMNE